MSDETTPATVAADFELADLTDAQLTKLIETKRAAILDAASAVTDKASSDALLAQRAEYDAIVAAQAERVTAGAETIAAQEAAAAAVAGLETAASDTSDAEGDAADEGSDDEGDATTEGEAAADDSLNLTGSEVRELVLAALGKVTAGATISTEQAEGDQNTETIPEPGRPRLAAMSTPFQMTGGSGLPAGKSEPIVDVIREINRTPRPNGEMSKVILAAATIDGIDEEKLLRAHSGAANEKIIRTNLAEHRERNRDLNTGDRSARLAALCAPSTIMRDGALAGTDATPVSDAFSWLNSEGAGNALSYEYRTPIGIGTAGDGIGVWNESDQEYVDPTDPDTWKPSHSISCPDFVTSDAHELVASWDIDTWTAMSSPGIEAEIAFNMGKLWARYWDGDVLRAMHRFAKRLTYTGSGSGLSDVIASIQRTLTDATYTERLDKRDYTAFLPPALLDLLVMSEARKAFDPDTAGPDSANEILAEIEHATGVAVVQALDLKLEEDDTLASNPYGSFGTAGDGTTPGGQTALPHPDSSTAFNIYLADTASFQPFQTNKVTLGQQVTLDQARQNKRGIFMAQYIGFMKAGIAPVYEVALTTKLNGGYTGFVTADASAAY